MTISTETSLFLQYLLKYCVKYDRTFGSYPESTWEGKAVFEDILDFMAEDKIITLEAAELLKTKINAVKVYEH